MFFDCKKIVLELLKKLNYYKSRYILKTCHFCLYFTCNVINSIPYPQVIRQRSDFLLVDGNIRYTACKFNLRSYTDLHSYVTVCRLLFTEVGGVRKARKNDVVGLNHLLDVLLSVKVVVVVNKER